MFVSKYSEEEKKRWMEEFKRNGKSAKAYAKEIGVPASTIRFWARKEINKKYNNSFGKIKIVDDVTTNITGDKTQVKYCGSKITIILEKGYDKKFLMNVIEVLVNDK